LPIVWTHSDQSLVLAPENYIGTHPVQLKMCDLIPSDLITLQVGVKDNNLAVHFQSAGKQHKKNAKANKYQEDHGGFVRPGSPRADGAKEKEENADPTNNSDKRWLND
jgi:hypothetical protein